jgi:hypothetical protein
MYHVLWCSCNGCALHDSRRLRLFGQYIEYQLRPVMLLTGGLPSAQLMIYHVVWVRPTVGEGSGEQDMSTQQPRRNVIKAAGRLDRDIATRRAAHGRRSFETVLSMAEVTTVGHARPTMRPNLHRRKTMWPRRSYRIASAGSVASNKQRRQDGRAIPR